MGASELHVNQVLSCDSVRGSAGFARETSDTVTETLTPYSTANP